MGAITSMVKVGQLPWGNAAASGLQAEIWQLPASTAGDTQTITARTLAKINWIVGPVSHTALTDNTAALITSVTVAASNFVEFMVIGPARSGPSLS
jgi:hypothetical protein